MARRTLLSHGAGVEGPGRGAGTSRDVRRGRPFGYSGGERFSHPAGWRRGWVAHVFVIV